MALAIAGTLISPVPPGVSAVLPNPPVIPLQVEADHQPEPPKLEHDGKSLVLPRYTPGGEIYVDDKFAGFVPAKIAIPLGEHSLSVLYSGYPEYNVRYTFKLTITTHTLDVQHSDFDINDCLDADPGLAKAWATSAPSKFDLAVGTPVLHVPGPIGGSDTCQYQLGFGTDRYFRLKITSEPPGAEIRIQNYQFGTTPATVMIRRYVGRTGPALPVMLSKPGFYPGAILFTGQAEVHSTLTPLPKTP
jgi:hypothetical protein